MTEALTHARTLAAQGMIDLRAGDASSAETAFSKAIEMGWPGADIWVAMSQARRLSGNRGGRETALRQAIKIDPSNLRAQLYLAGMLAETEDVSAATRLYAKAIAARGGAAQTPEMTALLAEADAFLARHTAMEDSGLDYRAKFSDLNLGDHLDDDLFEQSLAIASGHARAFASQPTKYFFPGLPARQFYPPQMFDWAAALESQTPLIQAELNALLAGRSDGFAPYVEGAGREGAGVTHTLVDNPDWSAFYLLKQGERQEANIAACPKTWAAIEAIGHAANPHPAPSVLFSLLKPGARIPPHHGMLNTRLICHLPLVMPAGCGFRVGNETRAWSIGEMFAFDDTIEHEAWNESGEARYILIFEIWHPSLTARQIELLTRFYELQGKV
jgi:aspartyl/asparaginyl beta-hydroxylase (cupin superfamily)